MDETIDWRMPLINTCKAQSYQTERNKQPWKEKINIFVSKMEYYSNDHLLNHIRDVWARRKAIMP